MRARSHRYWARKGWAMATGIESRNTVGLARIRSRVQR
jgi:hypothetical protein